MRNCRVICDACAYDTGFALPLSVAQTLAQNHEGLGGSHKTQITERVWDTDRFVYQSHPHKETHNEGNHT